MAATAPFSGYLEDLLGRRNIAMSGAALLCIGCLILGTAQGFAQAVAGLAIAGAGAGVGELTSLAGLVDHSQYGSCADILTQESQILFP